MTATSRAPWVLVLLAVAAGAQGRVSPAGRLQVPRLDHSATLLADGRVLVVGGRGLDGVTALASVELYQPRTGTWSQAAPLATPRAHHTATLLADGRVLVAGGVTHEASGEAARFVAVASVELYSPATGRWTPGPPLQQAREGHGAALLADGTVLVAGGTREGRQALASAERLAPRATAWAPAAALPTARWGLDLLALPDGSAVALQGRVLEAGDGGVRPKVADAVCRYLPAADAWEVAPALSEGRMAGTATWLPSLGVLALGGHTGLTLTNLGEAWRPGAPAFVPLPAQLPLGLAHHTATALPDGSLLVVGGERPESLDSPWAVRFDGSRWCLAGQLQAARLGHTATLLKDGRVLVVGGTAGGIPEGQVEVWSAVKAGCTPPP